MKTRSEWGSWEDWMEFEQGIRRFEHAIPRNNIFGACVGSGRYEEANAIEEARRLAVESFSNIQNIPLPWRPDYDLSTVEGCKEAIKSCGYKVNLPYPTCNVSVIKIEDDYRLKSINVTPTLEQWQEAAQFAIDNHEH